MSSSRSSVSYSSFQSADCNEIVKKVKGGDFSEIDLLVPKLSPQECEFLADFIVELYSNQDILPLIFWLGSQVEKNVGNPDELANVTAEMNGFTLLIRQRTIFGDMARRLWGLLFIPYVQAVSQAAEENLDITTVEGKERVIKIIDVWINAMVDSVPDSPVFLRYPVLGFHKSVGRGNHALDTCMLMYIRNLIPILADPFLLGFIDESAQGKQKEIFEECSKFVQMIYDQSKDQEVEEPYRSSITKYNSSLNTFMEEFYDEKSIETYNRIVNSTVIYDQKKLERAEKKLLEFLEGLKDTVSLNSQDSVDEKLTPEKKKQLTDLMFNVDWELVKKENGISYWEWEKEGMDGVVVRMDGKIRANFSDCIESIISSVFSDNPNFNCQTINEVTKRMSYVRKLPTPFSNRFISFTSTTSIEEKEAFLYLSHWNSEVPSGALVHAKFGVCGAHLRVTQDPEVQNCSILIRYNPRGDLPNWSMKKLEKSLQNRIISIFTKNRKK